MKTLFLIPLLVLLVIPVAYGQESTDSAPSTTINASVDKSLYKNGDLITVSGQIQDYTDSNYHGQKITFIVITPDELGRVAMGQMAPNSEGFFSDTFQAGGPLWKINGDYSIQLHIGDTKNTVFFDYVGGSSNPAPIECTSNETLVNGQCVENQPPPPPSTEIDIDDNIIEELKAENTKLKVENKQLKNKINSLESEIQRLNDKIDILVDAFVVNITKLQEYFYDKYER